ncbi:MAG TPA: hypothetical protein VMD91_15565 [Candidatus Sulfotelmatobacter sp.]|nr:hypothetical protein [Candidatus Sulfotelmatobacter sp.]
MDITEELLRLPFPDRRRGPRRRTQLEVGVDRRSGDRRRRKPGLDALIGAVLGEPFAWEREQYAVSEEPSADGESEPARRHGPRRTGESVEVAEERRAGDRRRTPGIVALLRAIFGRRG